MAQAGWRLMVGSSLLMTVELAQAAPATPGTSPPGNAISIVPDPSYPAPAAPTLPPLPTPPQPPKEHVARPAPAAPDDGAPVPPPVTSTPVTTAPAAATPTGTTPIEAAPTAPAPAPLPPPPPSSPPAAPSQIPPTQTARPLSAQAAPESRREHRRFAHGGQYIIHRDGALWYIRPQGGGAPITGEVILDARMSPSLARAARKGYVTLYVDGHWFGRQLVVTALAGSAPTRSRRERPWWQVF